MTALLALLLSQSIFVPVVDGGVVLNVATDDHSGLINLFQPITFSNALVAANTCDVQGNLNIYSTTKMQTASSGSFVHNNDGSGFIFQGNRASSDTSSSNFSVRGQQCRTAGPEFDVLDCHGNNRFQVDARGDAYLGAGTAGTSCNNGGSLIDATGVSGHPLTCAAPGLYQTHMGRLPAMYQGIHGNNTFASENCLVQGGYLGEFANKCANSSADKKLMVNDLGFLLWPASPNFADLPPCGHTDGGVMVDGGPWVPVSETTFGYVIDRHGVYVCTGVWGGWKRVALEDP